MQKINKKIAFSLVEVIVATWILSITVFWIYKMLWENNKLIQNSNNTLTTSFMFENTKQCLKWQASSINENTFLNFWKDFKSCNFTTNETKTTIDNIDYYIKIKNRKIEKTTDSENIYFSFTTEISSSVLPLQEKELIVEK